MGLSEDEAHSSVRFCFGAFNTRNDVAEAVDAISEIVQSLRAFDGAGAFAA